MAAEYADSIAKPGLNFHIFSDNQAGLWRLKTPSDNPGQSNQIRAIQASQATRDKGATITYHWVPGHHDIAGNEMADHLAKGATKMRATTQETSFATLGMQIKQITKDEWASKLDKLPQITSLAHYSYRREYEWKIQNKMHVPMGTPRETAAAFYQLKLGHGRFRDYLHRRGHAEFDLCWCGDPQTPAHLLLTCVLYKKKRKKIMDSLKPSKITIRLLMTTSRGVKATLNFITSTKIATRGWYRREEAWFEGLGEEEEERGLDEPTQD